MTKNAMMETEWIMMGVQIYAKLNRIGIALNLFNYKVIVLLLLKWL